MNPHKILETIENGNYEYYGIRVESGIEYKIGDCTNESRVWDDNEVTEYTLDGTSCIGIKFNANLKDIEKAIEIADDYCGTNIYLIAGNYMEYGEDNGEYIIRDAQVIDIIK